MKTNVAMGMIVAAVIATSGCMVSEKKYVAAVEEAETVKTDLEKTRAQKTALEQQVKGLRDANSKMTADQEFVSAELQRIKDSREKERSSIDGRTKELEQKVKDLSAQHRALKQEYDDVKKHNETLKATVTRYQKELKERERSLSMPAQPVIPRSANPIPSPVPAPKGPGSPSSSKGDPFPPSSSGSRLAPVNVNTASAGDLVLFLGLTQEMADRIITNRPYKVKGELVARNVLPKATFDELKDRMTVNP
ncbi:MAG: helix-hairpin-helix domain-containing protein [Nitrospiraceae bacterium]